jgi:mRNA deadenylase 3'-5' endonuclease subunit Ccr4
VTWQSGPDVICLQEVQADHYESWWRPQLARHGYSGTYSAKTKEAMGEHARISAIAISTFCLVLLLLCCSAGVCFEMRLVHRLDSTLQLAWTVSVYLCLFCVCVCSVRSRRCGQDGWLCNVLAQLRPEEARRERR